MTALLAAGVPVSFEPLFGNPSPGKPSPGNAGLVSGAPLPLFDGVEATGAGDERNPASAHALTPPSATPAMPIAARTTAPVVRRGLGWRVAGAGGHPGGPHAGSADQGAWNAPQSSGGGGGGSKADGAVMPAIISSPDCRFGDARR